MGSLTSGSSNTCSRSLETKTHHYPCYQEVVVTVHDVVVVLEIVA